MLLKTIVLHAYREFLLVGNQNWIEALVSRLELYYLFSYIHKLYDIVFGCKHLLGQFKLLGLDIAFRNLKMRLGYTKRS